VREGILDGFGASYPAAAGPDYRRGGRFSHFFAPTEIRLNRRR